VLQLLPPRQRAALILRDVLDFSTREVAEMLATSEDSIASALKRARTTLGRELPSTQQRPPLPNSHAERALLSRLVQRSDRRLPSARGGGFHAQVRLCRSRPTW
jgi:RNA polymerase sigma-70 factor (ECF subfamily)